ncbi:hypothetical protein MSMAP_1665 [Methanosarcina mazei SarPi]|uniref:Uncharacterized protein n=1 Tax=Methanosarcina mazei SarPi TaxID=1434115 RepID=A0A0E3RC90_METMZ|nr:hypothetical protein MSMAP_1665 [Methanosarcina mazei SarPi]
MNNVIFDGMPALGCQFLISQLEYLFRRITQHLAIEIVELNDSAIHRSMCKSITQAFVQYPVTLLALTQCLLCADFFGNVTGNFSSPDNFTFSIPNRGAMDLIDFPIETGVTKSQRPFSAVTFQGVTPLLYNDLLLLRQVSKRFYHAFANLNLLAAEPLNFLLIGFVKVDVAEVRIYTRDNDICSFRRSLHKLLSLKQTKLFLSQLFFSLLAFENLGT